MGGVSCALKTSPEPVSILLKVRMAQKIHGLSIVEKALLKYTFP
jgi:hypothetical protein